MLALQLGELTADLPAGVAEALDVVAGFDHALIDGLARLDAGTADATRVLAATVTGSPLGASAAAAVASLGTTAPTPEELAALCGARAALLGAIHDALLGRVDTVTGRERLPWPEESFSAAPDSTVAACRSWLQELAITGWRGIDHDLVAAADQAIEALFALPDRRRLAFLLDGFAAELRACAPIATLPHLPVRRWADLWSRAMLLTWRGPDRPPAMDTATVSGRLFIIGVDMQEHGTAVQAQVYAVLEPADATAARRVRISVSAPKVDTVVGPAVWQLLTAHQHLRTALAEHRSLELVDMPLLAGGDLLWDDARAEVGEPADPFATARVQLPGALAAAVSPLDRDPVHIAEPVLIEGYRIIEDRLELDGAAIAVNADRLPSSGPLDAAAVRGSVACIGLLRWDDGRWSLRPLAVQRKVKGKVVEVHGGDWACGPTDPKVVKAQAKSGDAVAVLRERAGRLLRT
ncbi:hypothetical protein [Nocardia cyriacigeorgica]|uniref:hypothetical protein n=1 Tax=Nocardia cyriacigeorgica TaxID=135487 RepID=UPI00245417BE|nr:hypothetical protein [Nocardia cyriacigeorgica]